MSEKARPSFYCICWWLLPTGRYRTRVLMYSSKILVPQWTYHALVYNTWKKISLIPTQKIEFLRFLIDSRNMSISISEKKTDHLILKILNKELFEHLSAYYPTVIINNRISYMTIPCYTISRPLNCHGFTLRHMVSLLFSRSHGSFFISHGFTNF